MEMTWVGMSVAVSRRWSKKCEPLSPLVSDRVGFFGTAGVRPHGWLFAQRKALLRGSWSEAGERFGVVNAPNRSQLPAVRAVSGFPHRGCKVAIFKPSGLRFPEKPLLRHCQRGCKQRMEVFSIFKNKVKFALWLYPETKELVEKHYGEDNCDSQSAFIEKAIRFYCGYLAAQDASEFLPRVIADALEGRLVIFGKRLCRVVYKLAVHVATCCHITAFDKAPDYSFMDSLQRRCNDDVAHTNGEFSFYEILRFQKGD